MIEGLLKMIYYERRPELDSILKMKDIHFKLKKFHYKN